MGLFTRFFGQEAAAPLRTAASPADSAVAARLGAIETMPDGLPLRQLAGLSRPAGDAAGAADATTRDARLRVARLIDDGAIDVVPLMAESPDPVAVLSLVTLCKNGDRLPAALAAIEDSSLIAALVTSGASSRLRQLAAETIENPEELRRLLRQVRDKDKGVYKILKQKSDVLLAAERRQAGLAAEVEAVSAALERHSRRPFDPGYISTFDHLRARWQALAAPPTDETAQHADAAMERCQNVIADHAEQLARLQAQQAAERAVQVAARETEERLREEAAAAEAALRESEAVAERETAARLAAARAAEQAQSLARREAERESYRHLETLLRKAHAVLSDGDTKRASTLRRSLDEKLAAAPELPPQLARQLQQLDAKLQELKQWKDFAVAPKRVELVVEMESLIGLDEEPKRLAGRIRALQDEWRTIGKGIAGDVGAETDRFQKASQLAYQPCREYFEAQARLRRDNLEKRQALLERLTSFEAAQTPENFDWRLVSQALREAPQEWRTSFPVEREAGRALQEDFDSRIKRLKAMLAAWYDSNVAEKQALIEQARGLLARSDSREAVEAMKHLQARWKETKPAPRDRDGSLWTEFRAVCDEVYQKRQQAHIDHLAALEADRSAAIELEAAKARAASQRALDILQADANLATAGRLIQACQWAAANAAPAAEQSQRKEAATAFIEGTAPWPKGALPVLREVVAKAHETTLDEVAAREKALKMLCIQCEILTGMTTPPEDQPLRREYQVQRLKHSMGQGTRIDETSAQSAMLEWLRIAAVAPDEHARLEQRFSRCVARLTLLRGSA